MKKIKKQRKIASLLIILALLSVYLIIPGINRVSAVDSIYDAKVTITDSQPWANGVTYTFEFTTGTSTQVGGYYRLVFPSGFDIGSATTTCADGELNASTSNQDIDCYIDQTPMPLTGTATKAVVSDVRNHVDPDDYTFWIYHYDEYDLLQERVAVMTTLISDVLLTATVDSTLDFNIYGVDNGIFANGVLCNGTSTATSTPFGTLNAGASSTICQRLTVQTNAEDGYSVTVEEDHDLNTNSGANINNFNNSPNDTGSSTPGSWDPPQGILDQYHTYGHFGLTSTDNSLSWGGGGDPFGTGLYVGFEGSSTTIEVMYHTGPSAISYNNVGSTTVAYTAEISALQEAGDYNNTLTYICTPQY